MITRDEFIDGFLDRAGIPRRYRTADGIEIGSFRRVAVPCALAAHEHTHYLGPKAGSVVCSGWVLEEPSTASKRRGGEYKVTNGPVAPRS